MIKITTTAGRLAAAYSCAATQDVRYFLNGVFFERDGDTFHLVATDGHRLFAMRAVGDSFERVHLRDVAAETRESVILSLDKDILTDLRKKANRDIEVVITITDSESLITYNGRTAPVTEVDGKYPDWRRVVPTSFGSDDKDVKAGSVGVNMRYMADAFKTSSFLNSKKDHGVEMTTNGPSNSIMFKLFTDDIDVQAKLVIMPMRL